MSPLVTETSLTMPLLAQSRRRSTRFELCVVGMCAEYDDPRFAVVRGRLHFGGNRFGGNGLSPHSTRGQDETG